MPNAQPIWGFWDAPPSQQPLSTQQRTQLALWAASLRYAHPDSTVTVWTRRSVIPPEYVTVGSDLEQSGVRIAYFNHVSDLFRDTPLDTYEPPEQLSKAELSDIVRLALLYTYGGTWVDIDDITIRPFTTQRNVLGTFVWPAHQSQGTYWGSTFELAPGRLVTGGRWAHHRFHIQNDPMVQWDRHHPFLHRWMTHIADTPSSDWGQRLPTDLIRQQPSCVFRERITLVPQHHLLLHPAFGNDPQFGYPTSKGPMFPPFDQRLTGRYIHYDDALSGQAFWALLRQTLHAYPYSCVKHSKNIGFHHSQRIAPTKWFVSHLAQPAQLDTTLRQCHRMDVERHPNLCYRTPRIWQHSTSFLGRIPYPHYNTSLLRVTPAECERLTHGQHRCTAVIVTVFAAFPGMRYGTMNWIGLMSYRAFQDWIQGTNHTKTTKGSTHSSVWLIAPHLLQHDKGPKYADVRLFRTASSIGLVGYTRVAPHSNTPGIADYYVRATLLETVTRPVSHESVPVMANTSPLPPRLIDGGCFPHTLGHRYRPFQPPTPTTPTIPTIPIDPEDAPLEFRCVANEHAQPICPHSSKHPQMPSSLSLNGIEVSFSTQDRNESPETHIARKNIVPVQPTCPLENEDCCAFVDMQPPDGSSPCITVMHLSTATVWCTSTLHIHPSMQASRSSGSSPFVQLNHLPLWLAIVHTKQGPTTYRHDCVVCTSRTVTKDDSSFELPYESVFECVLDDTLLMPNQSSFLFVTGLSVEEVHPHDEHGIRVEMVLSYGIDDQYSAVTSVTVRLPPVDTLYRLTSYDHLMLSESESETTYHTSSESVPFVVECCIDTLLKRKPVHSRQLQHLQHLSPSPIQHVSAGDTFVVEPTVVQHHYKVVPCEKNTPASYLYAEHVQPLYNTGWTARTALKDICSDTRQT